MPSSPARRAAAAAKTRSSTARPPVASQKPNFSRGAWLADILRERIVSGVYPAGERIREAELQKEFGFSNGPIREALQQVVADGLAERAPWQGVRVVELGPLEIVELFQVRVALLEYAAELAARRMSPETAQHAKELKKSFDLAFNEAKAGSHDPLFGGQLSRWLLTAAGNVRLHQVWDRTMLQTLIYVNASMRRSGGSKTKRLIYRLIDSIVAGDAPAARQAARDLTRQTLLDLNIDGMI